MIPRLKRQTKKRHTWSKRRMRKHAHRAAMVALVEYTNRAWARMCQPIIGARLSPDVWAT